MCIVWLWFLLSQPYPPLLLNNHLQRIPGGNQLYFRCMSGAKGRNGGLKPGGALNFFSGRGVRPARISEVWGLRTGICLWKGGALVSGKFSIWGLVSWNFPNLGACELKISKFGGLWAKIWVKIEAVEAKISKFSQKGVLWTDSFAWNGTLASGRRGVKRGSSGPHIPIPPF